MSLSMVSEHSFPLDQETFTSFDRMNKHIVDMNADLKEINEMLAQMNKNLCYLLGIKDQEENPAAVGMSTTTEDRTSKPPEKPSVRDVTILISTTITYSNMSPVEMTSPRMKESGLCGSELATMDARVQNTARTRYPKKLVGRSYHRARKKRTDISGVKSGLQSFVLGAQSRELNHYVLGFDDGHWSTDVGSNPTYGFFSNKESEKLKMLKAHSGHFAAKTGEYSDECVHPDEQCVWYVWDPGQFKMFMGFRQKRNFCSGTEMLQRNKPELRKVCRLNSFGSNRVWKPGTELIGKDVEHSIVLDFKGFASSLRSVLSLRMSRMVIDHDGKYKNGNYAGNSVVGNQLSQFSGANEIWEPGGTGAGLDNPSIVASLTAHWFSLKIPQMIAVPSSRWFKEFESQLTSFDVEANNKRAWTALVSVCDSEVDSDIAEWSDFELEIDKNSKHVVIRPVESAVTSHVEPSSNTGFQGSSAIKGVWLEIVSKEYKKQTSLAVNQSLRVQKLDIIQGTEEILWVAIVDYANNKTHRSFDPGGVGIRGSVLEYVQINSLLFSAFEWWLVAEHNTRGFKQQWIPMTYSKTISNENGLVAIIAGRFKIFLVDSLSLSHVAPYNAAACFLAIGMTIIIISWPENDGDPSENEGLLTQFKNAASSIVYDEKITWLGAVHSLVKYEQVNYFNSEGYEVLEAMVMMERAFSEESKGICNELDLVFISERYHSSWPTEQQFGEVSSRSDCLSSYKLTGQKIGMFDSPRPPERSTSKLSSSFKFGELSARFRLLVEGTEASQSSF